MFKLSILEIMLRLIAAVFIAGVIGYDREHKNRPAGIRTHVLVCVGACIIALTQQEIICQVVAATTTNPHLASVLKIDESRLIAQVVSGIGFLGAGTIVITRHAVTGLTTAASLWAVAGIGIAIGMGYYAIGLASAVVVFAVLVLLQKVIRVNQYRKLEIKYLHKHTTKILVRDYFKTQSIQVNNEIFRTDNLSADRIYTSVFTLELPKSTDYGTIVNDLSLMDSVVQARMISL
jgi:putative Mg2+ transporter-C (MgtC) family protein